MKYATTALLALASRSVSAFRPITPRFASSTTTLHANVLKLSDPQSELLDQVDVFIFDCDGVIWRVGSSGALAGGNHQHPIQHRRSCSQSITHPHLHPRATR